MTTYNTGKVKIGAHYQRPRPLPIHSKDAMRIQSALLDRRTTMPLNVFQRLICACRRWLA